ncbi:MAG: RDD family protein [Deltaproteobacteria bacterium]|nr:RDD family protein [Deltaproteobacteria bacterium]
MEKMGLLFRALAFIVDHVLLALVAVTLVMTVYILSGPPNTVVTMLIVNWYKGYLLTVFIGLSGIYFLYHFVMEVYFSGTVGKLLLELKMETENGVALGFPQRIIRHAIKFVATYITFFTALSVILAVNDGLARALMYRSTSVAINALQTAINLKQISPLSLEMIKYFAPSYAFLSIMLLLCPRRQAIHDLMAGSVINRYTGVARSYRKIERERETRQQEARAKEEARKQSGETKKAVDELIFK